VLTDVTVEREDPNASIGALELAQHCEGAVRAGVVHKHELEAQALGGKH
jgi:hypothetical protein